MWWPAQCLHSSGSFLDLLKGKEQYVMEGRAIGLVKSQSNWGMASFWRHKSRWRPRMRKRRIGIVEIVWNYENVQLQLEQEAEAKASNENEDSAELVNERESWRRKLGWRVCSDIKQAHCDAHDLQWIQNSLEFWFKQQATGKLTAEDIQEIVAMQTGPLAWVFFRVFPGGLIVIAFRLPGCHPWSKWTTKESLWKRCLWEIASASWTLRIGNADVPTSLLLGFVGVYCQEHSRCSLYFTVF